MTTRLTYWLEWIDDSGDPADNAEWSFDSSSDFATRLAEELQERGADLKDMALFIGEVAMCSRLKMPVTTFELGTGRFFFGCERRDDGRAASERGGAGAKAGGHGPQ